MRIINADALKDNMFHYAAPEMVWDRGDIEHKINEMPEIKAIPIEWLNQKYAENDPNTHEEDYDYYLWNAIAYILTLWEEELGSEED